MILLVLFAINKYVYMSTSMSGVNMQGLSYTINRCAKKKEEEEKKKREEKRREAKKREKKNKWTLSSLYFRSLMSREENGRSGHEWVIRLKAQAPMLDDMGFNEVHEFAWEKESWRPDSWRFVGRSSNLSGQKS